MSLTPRDLLLRAFNLVALPAILLALWWWLSASSTSPFLPPLERILDATPNVWNVGTLRDAVLPSLARMGAGYAIACVLGVGIGIVLGLCRRVEATVAPVLELLRAMPPPVLVPALIVLVGIGERMRLSLVVLGCLWPVLLNTVDGVRSIDGVLLDTARTQHLTRAGRLRHLVLPAASPRIAAGMYQALGIAVVLMVISEMFAASNGIGAKIIRFQQSFAITNMWSGVLMLGVIGIALSVAFRLVEARVLRWHAGARRMERAR